MPLRVDPGQLSSAAARLEQLRDAVNPAKLPTGFSPAGQDPVSVSVANRIAGKATEAVSALWSTWASLDSAVRKLHGSAAGYENTEESSAAALRGSSSSAGAPAVPQAGGGAVPAVSSVPQMSTPAPVATPEELAAALRSGAGTAEMDRFAQSWSSYAETVGQAAADAEATRAALEAGWDGDAHTGADTTLLNVSSDLSQHVRTASRLSSWTSTHAGNYRNAVHPESGVPDPAQFAQWRQNLDSAVAADAQFPGVYTPAVIAAQEQLGQGYAQTATAYGEYAVDPVTGELIDPATGLPVDPATGLPVSEDVADVGEEAEEMAPGEEMLSSGGQLLTAMLGGAVGAVGGLVGGLSQAGQQLGQMATQGVGQLAKAAADSQVPDIGDVDLSGSDFGGGFGGGSGGGGGGTVPASGVPGPGVSAAGAPPPPAPTAAGVGPSGIRTGADGAGMRGMGGMPMMPMGAPMGAMGAQSPTKAEPSAESKKLTTPSKPNAARVIGETSTERLGAKRERREQRMKQSKEAGETKND